MRTDVEKRFEELWKAEKSPPDVFTFVEGLRHSSDSDDGQDDVILGLLLRDQQLRWRTTSPLSVEDYLSHFPDFDGRSEIKLCLARGEFLARQRSDSQPEIDEFAQRFSDIRDTLLEELAPFATPNDRTLIYGEQTGGGKTDFGDSFLSETFASEPVALEICGGRYRLQRILGEGGFGRVYLAFDQELHRQVALKLPTGKRFKHAKHAELYLEEARTVASLDHPNIVPVYDMGRNEDGSIYVVSKFIEGQTLTKRLKDEEIPLSESADILATVAMGLHHAHERRVVHRDVKPSNILLESATGRAYVADFGLAIREEDYLKSNSVAGTPDYMSPEQARGEGHRLDGRSDVYSMGVVLYELLAGKRPFRGSTRNELLHQTISVDPPSLRSQKDSIPNELERICMKALSKRASDRYESAQEFAEDLLSWQQGPENSSIEQHIVPKGLRSFDADDADFFLDLLPGPRSRDGLPDVVRFWKSRIEESDSERTFAIGLIYGPSGCGKSSIVKAGLLPRLAQDINAIYLEATPSDTEKRILRGLRKQVPGLPPSLGLVETFQWLRKEQRNKTVVILDQFEQWLHAHRGEQNTDLVNALRQCDGGHLQAIVMVRDDFSMAASRFMRELERAILEGHNFFTVDLFDIDHAAKVLKKFGQAFGKLPGDDAAITPAQHAFLDSVANGLATDGKVVSVRLALFAEMVKGKAWEPETLRAVGGTEGIGANFLEEMFGSRDANPDHLLHQEAARQVLMLLLPEVGSEIKGHMRSHAELLAATDYQNRPRDFDELLRILDGKLRLITPTDPEGSQTDSVSDRSLKCYQLTHDYLVPSLRSWLTRRQRESRRGRAELMLGERASLWNAKPETRHLPSAWEWANIQSLTNQAQWNDSQRKMMATAGRVHGSRTAIFIGALIACSLLGLFLRNRSIDRQNEADAEAGVRVLTSASLDEVPDAIRAIDPLRPIADPLLYKELEKHLPESRARLNVSLALSPSDSSQFEYLFERMLSADPEQLETLCELLEGYRPRLVTRLWKVVLAGEESQQSQLLQAASALAYFDPENTNWDLIADRVVDSLVSENPLRAATWIRALKPVRARLMAPLSVIYRQVPPERSQSEIERATVILADYAADRPEILSELLLDSKPQQFVELFDEFAAHDPGVRNRLHDELKRTLPHRWNEPEIESQWAELSPGIIQLFEDSDGLVKERFAFAQTMSIADFQSAKGSLRLSGYRPSRIRPYRHGSELLIASVWSRDGIQCQFATNIDLNQLHELDEEYREDGYIACDVAGYVSPANSDRYAGLWLKRQAEEDDSRIFAGIVHGDVVKLYKELAQSGHRYSNSLQCFLNASGQRLFNGVVMHGNNASTVFLNRSSREYDNSQFLHRVAWDLDPSVARVPTRPKVRNRQMLEQALGKVPDADLPYPTDLAVGTAHYHSGNFSEAKDRLNTVIEGMIVENEEGTEPLPADSSDWLRDAYRLRAILHARENNSSLAEEDLKELDRWSDRELPVLSAKVLVSAHLNRDTSSELEALEEFVEKSPNHGHILFDAARCYACLAGIMGSDSAARPGGITLERLYADRAIELLKRAHEAGLDDEQRIDREPDFDPIRERRSFLAFLQSPAIATRYVAVWNDSTRFESRTAHGVSVAEHERKAKDLIAEGFRISSLGVASVSGKLVVGAVWHRPLIADQKKESLARRQANAAIALIRMGAFDPIMPLLKETRDPRLRSWIVNLMIPAGVSPDAIQEQLASETDRDVRHSLLLALGETGDSPSIASNAFADSILEIYGNDDDAAVHAAAGWALNRIGLSEAKERIDRNSISTRVDAPDADDLSWRTLENGTTMVSIPGPIEFEMGSPYTEQNRSTFEYQHRVRIDRSFSIASTEVTVRQFAEFLNSQPLQGGGIQRKHAPDDSGPVLAVTWFTAAAYCRWLSEREGVPEHEMCYPQIDEIKSGMKLSDDYLSRTGYRLPTEAEWEYACRAGSTTSRNYGVSDALLSEYAWYLSNADGRVWPVGRLKPNAFGLFDMHGNVQEWCQSIDQEYDRNLGSVAMDRESVGAVNASDYGRLRGGSWVARAGEVRSAQRDTNLNRSRFNASGFRVARTNPKPSRSGGIATAGLRGGTSDLATHQGEPED